MRARTFLASSLLAATVLAGCHYACTTTMTTTAAPIITRIVKAIATAAPLNGAATKDAPAAPMAGITGATASRSQPAR